MDPIDRRLEELRHEQEALEASVKAARELTCAEGPLNARRGAPAVGHSRTQLLKKYFDAMSDFPDYHERRRQRLQHAEPFSFERRELQRPRSAASRRYEEEKAAREAELNSHLQQQFAANPVPAGTHVPKYSLMVEEWCARKEAVRVLAQERCRAEQEKRQPSIEFNRLISEQKHQSKQSVAEQYQREWAERHCKPFTANPVPKSVIEPRLLQLSVDAAERKQRARDRAFELLKAAKAPDRLATKTTTNRPAPVLKAVNPHLTFVPETRGAEVPCFAERWAKEEWRLAQRRQQRPPTQVAEFKRLRAVDPTVAKQRSISAVLVDIERDEAVLKESRWPYKLPRGRPLDLLTGKPRPSSAPSQPPRSTKAHTLKAEAAFRRIVDEQQSLQHKAEDERRRCERQRVIDKRMSAYLVSQGIDVKAVDRVIAEKTKEKREQTERQRKDYLQNLEQTKRKVATRAPMFADNVGGAVTSLAAARLAAEQRVTAAMQAMPSYGAPVGAPAPVAQSTSAMPPMVDTVVVREHLPPAQGTNPPPSSTAPSFVVPPAAKAAKRSSSTSSSSSFESSSSASSK